MADTAPTTNPPSDNTPQVHDDGALPSSNSSHTQPTEQPDAPSDAASPKSSSSPPRHDPPSPKPAVMPPLPNLRPLAVSSALAHQESSNPATQTALHPSNETEIPPTRAPADDLISVTPSSTPPVQPPSQEDVVSEPTTSEAMEALFVGWKNQHKSSSIKRIGTSSTTLDSATNPPSFTTRSQFELPDGGRFHLVLSGTHASSSALPSGPVPQQLTAMIEDGLGLPDGFLIDINTFLFGSLCESPAARSPRLLVAATLEHATTLYNKLVAESPVSVAPSPTPPSQGDAAGRETLKRKRPVAPYEEPQFGPSRLASTTLMKQVTILNAMDTKKDGFTAAPRGDDLYTWDVALFFSGEENHPIAKDLACLPGHDSIKLEFRFPTAYPNVPPFVRVVSPHIEGGHVAPHGGICMELLTTSGWAPVNSIDVVCIQIRTMLVHGCGRILPRNAHKVSNYTFEGALHDVRRIVRLHGWHVAEPRNARRCTALRS